MTRDDFRRIPQLRREMAKALDMWENAKASATRKTAVLTVMPKGNGVTSQIEIAIVKAEAYRERYDELCQELSDIYRRIKAESSFLNEQESKVIDMTYPQGKKTSEIATTLNLTERHVYRLKKSALSKLCH